MDDKQIIELYLQRDEQAVEMTQAKYIRSKFFIYMSFLKFCENIRLSY